MDGITKKNKNSFLFGKLLTVEYVILDNHGPEMKALFHRWRENDDSAMIEYENGTMDFVSPFQVRFTDRQTGDRNDG